MNEILADATPLIFGRSKDEWLVLGPILGGLLIFIATAITNGIQAAATRKAEARKHRRELAFRAAVEHWKAHSEEARRIISAPNTPPTAEVVVHPLDLYLVHAALLSDMLEGDITRENIGSKLQEVQGVYLAGADAIKEYSQKLRQRRP